MVKVADIKTKIESDFNKMFIHKAYVQYFYDSIHLESKLKPIERIPLVLRLSNFQESFILRKPSYYLNGKPVFQLLRGYPLSIQTVLLQENLESTFEILENTDLEQTIIKVKNALLNSVDKSVILELDNFKGAKIKSKKKVFINTHILEKRLVEKNSSFELDTWLQTSYNNVLLKKKFVDLQILVIFAMCIISACLCTWLVADNYFETYYKLKYKAFLIPLLIILKGAFYI